MNSLGRKWALTAAAAATTANCARCRRLLLVFQQRRHRRLERAHQARQVVESEAGNDVSDQVAHACSGGFVDDLALGHAEAVVGSRREEGCDCVCSLMWKPGVEFRPQSVAEAP